MTKWYSKIWVKIIALLVVELFLFAQTDFVCAFDSHENYKHHTISLQKIRKPSAANVGNFDQGDIRSNPSPMDPGRNGPIGLTIAAFILGAMLLYLFGVLPVASFFSKEGTNVAMTYSNALKILPFVLLALTERQKEEIKRIEREVEIRRRAGDSDKIYEHIRKKDIERIKRGKRLIIPLIGLSQVAPNPLLLIVIGVAFIVTLYPNIIELLIGISNPLDLRIKPIIRVPIPIVESLRQRLPNLRPAFLSAL